MMLRDDNFNWLRPLVLVFILFSTVFVFNGCFRIQELKISSSLKDSDPESSGKKSERKDSLVIRLNTRECLGCYFIEGDVCRSFPVNIQNARAEISGKAEKDSLSTSAGGYDGLLFSNFEELLKENLLKSFRKRFEKISFATAEENGVDVITITPSLEFKSYGSNPLSEQGVTIQLKAESSDGSVRAITKTSGKSQVSHSHLGWGIPVALIGFPVSFAVAQSVFYNLLLDCQESLVAEVLNKTADDLSEKLAQQIQSAQDNKVTVSMSSGMIDSIPAAQAEFDSFTTVKYISPDKPLLKPDTQALSETDTLEFGEAGEKEISAVKNHFLDLGAGYGTDYGGLAGARLELSPVPFLSVFGSFGYYITQPGWNTGVCVNILPKNTRYMVRPFLKFMYGTHRILQVKYSTYYSYYGYSYSSFEEVYKGITFGGGCELRFGKGKNNGFDFDLNFPVSSDELKDDIEDLKDMGAKINMLPFSFSLGYHWEI